MGIKEYFEKRKLLQKERLRKKILEEQEKKKGEDEKKKKEMEGCPKCSNCGKTYIQEFVGLNGYPHARGFCNDNCLTDYCLKSIKIIRQHMMMMDKGIISLDIRLKKIVNYLITQRRKK